MDSGAYPLSATIGLCAACAHVAVTRSAKGSTFYRCRRAKTDPAYAKYPPLPVLRCPGFEPQRPPEDEVRGG